MAFMQLYTKDQLVREIALKRKVTTIGRSQDCDIWIDNPGISELHARVRRVHDHFMLEDAKSRNGLLLNGETVDSKQLEYGDEIVLVKHRLMFVNEATGIESLPVGTGGFDALPQDETIEVDISKLQQTLRKTAVGTDAELLLQGVTSRRQDYPINKVDFKIGKSLESDIYLGGIFAPAQAASIQRRSDGYYIMPGRRGKVAINGKPVRNLHKIVSGDGIRVRNMRFSFRQG